MRLFGGGAEDLALRFVKLSVEVVIVKSRGKEEKGEEDEEGEEDRE